MSKHEMEVLIKNLRYAREPIPGFDEYQYTLTFRIDALSEYEIERLTHPTRGQLIAYVFGLAFHKARKLMQDLKA